MANDPYTLVVALDNEVGVAQRGCGPSGCGLRWMYVFTILRYGSTLPARHISVEHLTAWSQLVLYLGRV